jgi:hypothetical protein
MWCQGGMEKIRWADRVSNKEVFHTVKEEENILLVVKKKRRKV